MTRRHFIIATAGHVDHGKSSLIKALTQADLDRLPEEKARGITIDLGFARLLLEEENLPGTTFDIGVVDVPGHEDFVANMVAGVGTIDAALLVVAANDGWMPQTEEHLQILTYLGITRGVVALTKVDLVDGPGDSTVIKVRQRLEGSPFAQAPIVPVSVLSGRGLAELNKALAGVLSSAAESCDIGKPRLPVDRAFTLRGIGTVVTGTLRQGVLLQGQAVVLQPGGHLTRIRTIQTHHQELPVAGPGTRVALNLPGAQVAAKGDNGTTGLFVGRGCVVTLPDLGSAHTLCDVLLERSSRLQLTQTAGRPLKEGTRVRFHTGSANVPGRVYFSVRNDLPVGERCLAQVRLESPLFLFAGDRFVLRDWTERHTVGGGVVLNPCGNRRWRRVHAWNSLLTSPAPAMLTPGIFIKAQLEQCHVLRKNAVLAQSSFGPTEIAGALSQLSQAGECVLKDKFVFRPDAWKKLCDQAQTLIAAHHQARPEQAGLPLAELKSSLGSRLVCPDVFDALIADLERSGFVRTGSTISRMNYRPALPARLQAVADGIHSAVGVQSLDPPSRKTLGQDRLGQEALAFLIRAGDLVELSPEIVLSKKAFLQATETIRLFLHQHGTATVSELRQALGASRRVVVPLLEKLDRTGVTQREGDKRHLKRSA